MAQQKDDNGIIPIPGGFDIGKVKPARPAEPRIDIVVTARSTEESRFRLPLPAAEGEPSFCPNGEREVTERMQQDLLRAGRVLRGCRPEAHEEGDVTFRTTRIRRPGPRAGNGRGGAPAVGIVIHQ